MEQKEIKLMIASCVSVIRDAAIDVCAPFTLDDADKQKIANAKQLIFADDVTDAGTRKNLESIFNVLNGNNGRKHYIPRPVIDEDINYPTDEETSCDYESLSNRINACIEGNELTDSGLNSFLENLENELTYIPGTTNDPDISLFDQAKMIACVVSCLPDEACSSSDDLFLLYSMDFSGIQDFIYTINSKGALKTLRARSFYLELLMENIIDELLSQLNLSRVNVIYSGGGHCYLLLPNTDQTVKIIEEYNNSVNEWLLDTYDISLYVGHGYTPCSCLSLRNIPNGSYVELFRNVSREISDRKANRYTAEQIIRFNSRIAEDYSRECKVCRRIDKLNSEGECSICSAIKEFSNSILHHGFYCVVNQTNAGLPLPGGLRVVSAGNDTDSIDKRTIVRTYRKRQIKDSGISSRGLWIGDYASSCNTLEEMAADSKDAGRIERIGVLRADVDNLGTAFASGFKAANGGNILKTAALSRQLSLFFKYHINSVLSNKNRNATICYSGGDDLFIVGEWYSVIELAMDISAAFERYTEGALTLSAGIGIYDSKYPISRIAYETAKMEDLSKHLEGKNAITLFEDNTYHWNEFEGEVLGEKFDVLATYFDRIDSRGMSFLYKLLELIRNQDDRINFARFVYIISRLEPGKDSPPDKKDSYRVFSNNMCTWIRSENDRKQLMTAIMLYVYLTRNKEDKTNGISE